MNLVWTQTSWQEYLYWQQTDKSMLKKINQLIHIIQTTPYQGIGKPEPLKFDLAGKGSPSINHQHRIVYEIKEDKIIIYQCRYHY